MDSGTYIYNPAIYERLELKRGKAHNSVMLDDIEQCSITAERVFGLEGNIDSQIKILKKPGVTKYIMQHDGYKRLRDIGIVTREIVCFEEKVEIVDFLEGSGYHHIAFFLNLHPSVAFELDQNRLQLSAKQTNPLIVFPPNFKVQIEDCFFSQAYHEKVKSKCIVAKCRTELPFSWKTEIVL